MIRTSVDERNPLLVDIFSLVHVPFIYMEEAGFYLYCSKPPGGCQDASAPLVRSCHAVHLKQSLWGSAMSVEPVFETIFSYH